MVEENKIDYAKLITACLEGNDSAWEELIERVSPAILSVCRVMRLSQEESLDIFGQVCYLLLHNLQNLQSPDKIISYVATTTRREILRVLKRKQLFEKIDREITESISVTKFKSPDAQLHETAKFEQLTKAIMELSEKEFKLIWYLFLDENEPSYEEISKKMGIPVASIGPTRIRSLKKLKSILKRKGFDF